jgi:trk system potassium uptake protein TrkH
MVMVLCAFFMFVSAAVAWGDSSSRALLWAGVISVVAGALPVILFARPQQINSREGYVIVAMTWIAACLVGMLPFLLWRGGFTLSEAWFESVSGFTTTGATGVPDVESLPRGLLFWRSATHWIGGVGVVMLALVVLPSLGRTRLTLSSAELSPLARENYRYRAIRIAQVVLMLYVGMTAVASVALHLAGMGWFDAVNHAFSTVATGGFSTRESSIGYWNSAWIEGITMFFMLLSGMHYGVVFATLTGGHNNIFRSEVTRFYLATVVVAAAVVTASLWLTDGYEVGAAARQGVFQTVSIITTTGFTTADTTLWTPLGVAVMVWLMFQCGCAGSTSGGVKSDRIWLAVKSLRAQLVRQQHPNAVVRIKLGGVVQDQGLVNFAIFFVVLYIIIVAIGTILVAASGLDLETSFTMVAACMGNVGPGFGTVGSMDDYSHVAPLLKVLCTVFMLLGRLEIFGLIQLFTIKWWRTRAF